MIKKLKTLLCKFFGNKKIPIKQSIIPTEEIINLWEHNGWGNNVYFSDFKNRKITGHLSPRPKVGDEIRSKMSSGKIGRFLVKEIEYCRDPNDMFFCDVEDLGYLE